MNPRQNHDQGGQNRPVVVQVERPRTRDLEPSSNKVLSQLGAAVTAVLSIAGGFGAVVKTYHQVHANEAKLVEYSKEHTRLERKIRNVEKGLEWLCLEQLDPKACYSTRKRGLHANDDE